jgi:uncharacterized phage protein gp47/JayE
MPVLLSRTQEEILGEILYDITNSTNITLTSPGSKMRSLSQSVSAKIGNLYEQKDVDLINAFVNGAADQYLDFFGEILATPRYGPQTSSVSALSQNVKFYVSTGNFGDINSGSSILISSGTKIGTQLNGTGVVYRVLVDTVLAASSSSTYVSVEAEREGTRGNLGQNRLVYHNFTGYADYLDGGLLVTNDAEITAGRDTEDDANYRYRLINAVVGAEGANQTAVRLAALNVPGVADIVLLPFSRGLSTFDVIVKSVAANTPASLISAVQSAVNDVIAEGVLATVRAPVLVGTSMIIKLKATEALTDSEQDGIIEGVQRSLTDYVNNLDIGEDLIVNEIVQRTMEVSDKIKDMGIPSKPIDRLYIYKPSRLEDSRVRSELLTNYEPATDERVIIEQEEVSGDTISVSFVG